MVRPGLRGPTAAVSDRGLQEAATMKGEPLQASEQPAGVPASTGGRRCMSRWMLLPAFSLLGECASWFTSKSRAAGRSRDDMQTTPPRPGPITPTVGVA
jgi:hypothetical protein